jgi:hypothetical protein
MAEHPHICVSVLKEPNYFVLPASRRFGKMRRAPSRSWYQSLFEHCGPELVRGEGTTAYFYLPESAQMIRDAVPDVRLIFVLRDPAERAYSHYLHDLRVRRLPPFEQMVREDHPRLRHYVDISTYSPHLARYYSLFPRENVLVLTTDDMRADPRAVAHQCYAFLGVDAGFVPSRLDAKLNTAAHTRSRLVALVFAVRPLPLPVLNRLWFPVAGLARRLNQTEIDASLPAEPRSLLAPRFAGEIEKLESMLQRSFDEWKKP